jgi:hypothetical protein
MGMGLIRAIAAEAVPSSRKVDGEQPARLFVRFFRQFSNALVLLEIDIIDLHSHGSLTSHAASCRLVCSAAMVPAQV